MRIKNTGTTTVSSFNVSYVLNGAAPLTELWTGTLNPCDTVSVTFAAPMNLGLVNTISVYTDQVDGTADNNTDNDTVTASLYAPSTEIIPSAIQVLNLLPLMKLLTCLLRQEEYRAL